MPQINSKSTVVTPDTQGLVRGKKTLAKSLLNFADAASVNEMNKEASRRFLEGQQAAAQGASVQEVKDNQSAFTSMFGEGASVAGARSLATQNALDEAYRTSLAGIPDNAHLTPKQYAAFQQAELLKYVDGIEDEETRQAVTIGFSKKAGELAGLQTKAHAKHIDAQNARVYQQHLYSKGLSAQDAVGKGTETELSANKELLNAMIKPKGMGDAQYNSLLVKSIKSSLEEGNGALYNTFIEMDMTERLSPEQRATLHKAYDSYEKEQMKEQSVIVGTSLFDLNNQADDPQTDMTDLVASIGEHQQKYGMSAEKVNSILGRYKKAQDSTNSMKDNAHLARSRQFHLVTEKERPGALDSMREEFGSKYPEYWATIGVRDTKLAKQWTQSFQSLTLPDGEVDPRFVETAQEFMTYSAIDQDRAFDHITDTKAKARMKAVVSRAQIDGDIVSAVRQRALVEQNNAKGGFTKETKEEITDEVDDIMDSTILPNFLGGHDALDSFNTDYVRATIRRQTEDYMLNGRVSAEDAAELARMDFERQHEKIKGDYIPNGGTPFSVRLGLQDGDSPEESLDGFVEKHRTEMFAGHEGEYSTVFNSVNNSMTFVPVDDNGLPVAGGKTLSLDAMKSMNVLAHAKEHSNMLQAQALKQSDNLDARIQRVQMSLKRRYNQDISEEKALEIINTQDKSFHNLKTGLVKSLFDLVTPLKGMGATQEMIEKLSETVNSPEQDAVQAASDMGVQHGIALPTKSGMGWGVESVGVVGGTNEHVGYMLDVFAATESGSGKFKANPNSSARGVFQYMTKQLSGGNNAMQTAITRAKRAFPDGAPKWLSDLDDVAFNGTDEDRAKAMIELSDDHSAALMLLDFQGRPQTKALLDKVKEGDMEAMKELYFTYHHTNPDPATIALFEKNMAKLK